MFPSIRISTHCVANQPRTMHQYFCPRCSLAFRIENRWDNNYTHTIIIITRHHQNKQHHGHLFFVPSPSTSKRDLIFTAEGPSSGLVHLTAVYGVCTQIQQCKTPTTKNKGSVKRVPPTKGRRYGIIWYGTVKQTKQVERKSRVKLYNIAVLIFSCGLV